MQSRNKPAPTVAEARHIERIKGMDCIVCGCAGPSDAHEIEQGEWFTSLPLCRVCHMHPVYGLHGRRANWKARKLDELAALNALIGNLMKDAASGMREPSSHNARSSDKGKESC